MASYWYYAKQITLVKGESRTTKLVVLAQEINLFLRKSHDELKAPVLLAWYDKACAKALVTDAHDGAKRIGLAAITKDVFAEAGVIKGKYSRR